MPKVLNKRKDGVPKGAVYVGRPSKWGNPFTVGIHGDRDHCIQLYKERLITSGLINDIEELRGKDLVCWCAPEACHGDVLLELANK